MIRDYMIEQVSKKVDMPKHVVKSVLAEYGKGLKQELRYSTKSRINIPLLGSWKCPPNLANRYLKFNLLPVFKWARDNDPDKYERMSRVFRRVWEIKQDGIRYLNRKNAKYYANKTDELQ